MAVAVAVAVAVADCSETAPACDSPPRFHRFAPPENVLQSAQQLQDGQLESQSRAAEQSAYHFQSKDVDLLQRAQTEAEE